MAIVARFFRYVDHDLVIKAVHVPENLKSKPYKVYQQYPHEIADPYIRN